MINKINLAKNVIIYIVFIDNKENFYFLIIFK
jgi:hypothetical protein